MFIDIIWYTRKSTLEGGRHWVGECPFCLLFLFHFCFHFRFFPLFPSKIMYVLSYCITVNTLPSRDWCEVSNGAKISSQTKDLCRIKKWETIAEKLIDSWPLMVPPMLILQKFWDFCRNIFRNFNSNQCQWYHPIP